MVSVGAIQRVQRVSYFRGETLGVSIKEQVVELVQKYLFMSEISIAILLIGVIFFSMVY